MKRRDFIINSALLAGGAIMFSGCGRNDEIGCSFCSYCVEECKKGINIPEIFDIYNHYLASGDKEMFKTTYLAIPEEERADKCSKCGACSKNCPQNLKIPQLLAKIHKEYEKIS